MIIKDQINRTLFISKPPQRIVSLVPSQSVLLVDLGLQSKLVGVTKFCIHPVELRKQSAIVGGTKKVDLHKIASLQPDIIICNKEENTLDMVEACEKIAPVWVSDIVTIQDCLDMISDLGKLFQKEEKAEKMVKIIASEMEQFIQWVRIKPMQKVAYLIWKDPFMAAGTDTFIHQLLELNHFENILTQTRYPEVTMEQLHEADVVLLSSEPYPFKEKHVSEIQEKTNASVQLVDGEYFSWYGSRLQDAFQYFRSLHA
jgi:ABC-type Fe3+-hydroxamate transport system substrate-binding protein